MSSLQALMSQSDHTDDDIIALARIRRELSQDAKKHDILANKTEEEYNLARSTEFIKLKKQKRGDGKYYTDKEAENTAKKKAEEQYGKHRSLAAEVRGMYASLKALEQYIITLQSKKKNERDASGYNLEEQIRKWPIAH